MAAISKLFHNVVLATVGRSRFLVVVIGLEVGGGEEGGVTLCVGMVVVLVLVVDVCWWIRFGAGDCC